MPVLSAHPHRRFPACRIRQAALFLQAHHMTLGRPLPAAYGEEDVGPPPDHMKFRRPEGLYQLPVLIIVQNAAGFRLRGKKSRHRIRLPDKQADIVIVVIGGQEIPFPFPVKNHRVRPAHSQGKFHLPQFRLRRAPTLPYSLPKGIRQFHPVPGLVIRRLPPAPLHGFLPKTQEVPGSPENQAFLPCRFPLRVHRLRQDAVTLLQHQASGISHSPGSNGVVGAYIRLRIEHTESLVQHMFLTVLPRVCHVHAVCQRPGHMGLTYLPGINSQISHINPFPRDMGAIRTVTSIQIPSAWCCPGPGTSGTTHIHPPAGQCPPWPLPIHWYIPPAVPPAPRH